MDQATVAFAEAIIALLLFAGTGISAFWFWLRARSQPLPEFECIDESLLASRRFPMRNISFVRPAGLFATLLSLTLPLAAQTRFELGPLLGIHAPTAHYPSALYYSSGLPNSPQDLTGLALGLQWRYWPLAHVGIQVDGAVASSGVGGGDGPEGRLSSPGARVSIATAQVLLATRPAGRPRLWVSAGTGLVRYGGAAYAPYLVHTSVAFVAGIGSTFPLKRHLNLTGAVTSFTYGLRVRDSAGVNMEGGRQVDLRFQMGLTWTW